MDTLDEDQLRSLEQLRGRLYQLSQSFNTLHADINSSELSPESISLQIQTSIALRSLQSVSETLSKNAQLLGPLVAYPLPQFPGRYHEAKLQTMLRTRLETRVEDWIAHGAELGADYSLDADAQGFGPDKMKELWNWAAPQANEIAQEHIFFHNYTKEEKEIGVEKVVTGLKVQPVDDTEEDEDEEEDEEDDDDDDEEEGGGDKMDTSEEGKRKETSRPAALNATVKPPPLAMDKMLRFMTTGAMPS